MTKNERLAAWFGDVLSEETDLRRNALYSLCELSPEELDRVVSSLSFVAGMWKDSEKELPKENKDVLCSDGYAYKIRYMGPKERKEHYRRRPGEDPVHIVEYKHIWWDHFGGAGETPPDYWMYLPPHPKRRN